MRRLSHRFLVLILSVMLAVPLSLFGPNVTFAAECGSTSKNCSFTGETGPFGNKKKKYVYSKEWRSTGAPVDLTILEVSRSKELFVPINATLEKKTSNGKWENVDTIGSMKLNQTRTFRKNIEPNVTYRVKFYLVRDVNVLNVIKKYQIKQKQPKANKNYTIEPSFNPASDKITYKFYKNGSQKSVQGNLTYKWTTNSKNYLSGVDYLGWRSSFSPSANLLPQKTHYAGESNPSKKKSTVHAKFIGNVVGESTVFTTTSSLDIYRHTTGDLELKKEVKANGDIQLKITLPKHYPIPLKSAKKYGRQWELAIKQDKKVVDKSDKLNFKGRTVSYTIKRGKIDPSKKITVDIKLNAYDLQTKSTLSPQSGNYKVMNIYEAHGIKSFNVPKPPNGNGGDNKNNNGGKKGNDKKDDKKDDKKEKGANKDAQINLDAKVLKDKKEVEITAKLEKVDQPKGDWTLTLQPGTDDEKVEKLKDKGASVTKNVSIENFDQDEIKIVAQFKGEDKKGKIDVKKEKTIHIRDEEPKDDNRKDDKKNNDQKDDKQKNDDDQGKNANTDASITIDSNVLKDQKKVEIEATLKEVDQPVGDWKLVFNAGEKDEEVVEDKQNKDGFLKREFSIENIQKETVKVIATFKGKDKKGSIDVTQEEEIEINLEEDEDEDIVVDQSGAHPDEDEVEEIVVNNPTSPSGQLGGQLPKTATNHSTGIIAGILFLILGFGGLFFLRRRQTN